MSDLGENDGGTYLQSLLSVFFTSFRLGIPLPCCYGFLSTGETVFSEAWPPGQAEEDHVDLETVSDRA